MEDPLGRKASNQSWKVKVYLLNGTGNWDDCGTGTLEMTKESQDQEEIEYFKISTNEELLKGRSGDVSSERYDKLKGKHNLDDKMLLFLPVLKKNQYEKQGESIIAWVDKDLDEEIAISFLDHIAANETWRNICAKIGKSPIEARKAAHKDLERLIMPEVGNLEKIKNDLDTRKDWMICAIQSSSVFLKKLNEVFEQLEDLERFDELAKIHEIVKLMVFCDDSSFLELILSDEHYLLIFGAFEYDPDNSMLQRPQHRQFLKERSSFKRIIEIEDPNIVNKIHVNYRLNYLKDSVVSCYLDDQISNTFSTFIYYNNFEIYDHIIQHTEYLKALFSHFCYNLEDSIGFLSEFIQIVKTIIQNDAKYVVLEKFTECEAFHHMTEAFGQLDKMEMMEPEKLTILKIQLLEIIQFLAQIQISPFFNYLKSSENLLKYLLNSMYSGDQGLQILIADLFKFMMDISHEKKNEILDYLYAHLLPKLLEHFNELEMKQQFVNFSQEMIDILNHCVLYHGYRIRYYIIHHKLLQNLFKGFKLNNKTVTLAIIRFVKSIITSKDEFLIKHIANYNLLNDIFEVFFKNANKNNLINSACLELFEKIRTENIKKLVNNVVENFREEIVKHNLTKKFEKLFLKYEQINEGKTVELPSQENLPKSPSQQVAKENRFNSRELSSMQDEEYFDRDENGDTNSPPAHNNNNTKDTEGEKSQVQAQVQAEDKIEIENDAVGKPEKQGENNSKSENNNNGNTKDEEPNQLQENLQSSVDNITRIKNKIQSRMKEKEEEEESKTNFNKSTSRSNSIDRLNNTIKIQLKLTSSAENSGESGDESVSFEKRKPSQDMNADIENFSNDPQKKVKL